MQTRSKSRSVYMQRASPSKKNPKPQRNLILLLHNPSVRGSRNISFENSTLQILRSATLHLDPAEINPLSKFPCLNPAKEENSCDDDNGPFPGNSGVLEYSSVETGDINDREDCDKSRHNRPEKELVLPSIAKPLCQKVRRIRLHPKKRAPKIHHLPRQKQRKPSQTSETSCASAINGITRVAISGITTSSKTIVTGSVDDEREGTETECCDPDSVDDHV